MPAITNEELVGEWDRKFVGLGRFVNDDYNVEIIRQLDRIIQRCRAWEWLCGERYKWEDIRTAA